MAGRPQYASGHGVEEEELFADFIFNNLIPSVINKSENDEAKYYQDLQYDQTFLNSLVTNVKDNPGDSNYYDMVQAYLDSDASFRTPEGQNTLRPIIQNYLNAEQNSFNDAQMIVNSWPQNKFNYGADVFSGLSGKILEGFDKENVYEDLTNKINNLDSWSETLSKYGNKYQPIIDEITSSRNILSQGMGYLNSSEEEGAAHLTTLENQFLIDPSQKTKWEETKNALSGPLMESVVTGKPYLSPEFNEHITDIDTISKEYVQLYNDEISALLGGLIEYRWHDTDEQSNAALNSLLDTMTNEDGEITVKAEQGYGELLYTGFDIFSKDLISIANETTDSVDINNQPVYKYPELRGRLHKLHQYYEEIINLKQSKLFVLNNEHNYQITPEQAEDMLNSFHYMNTQGDGLGIYRNNIQDILNLGAKDNTLAPDFIIGKSATWSGDVEKSGVSEEEINRVFSRKGSAVGDIGGQNVIENEAETILGDQSIPVGDSLVEQDTTTENEVNAMFGDNQMVINENKPIKYYDEMTHQHMFKPKDSSEYFTYSELTSRFNELDERDKAFYKTPQNYADIMSGVVEGTYDSGLPLEFDSNGNLMPEYSQLTDTHNIPIVKSINENFSRKNSLNVNKYINSSNVLLYSSSHGLNSDSGFIGGEGGITDEDVYFLGRLIDANDPYFFNLNTFYPDASYQDITRSFRKNRSSADEVANSQYYGEDFDANSPTQKSLETETLMNQLSTKVKDAFYKDNPFAKDMHMVLMHKAFGNWLSSFQGNENLSKLEVAQFLDIGSAMFNTDYMRKQVAAHDTSVDFSGVVNYYSDASLTRNIPVDSNRYSEGNRVFYLLPGEDGMSGQVTIYNSPQSQYNSQNGKNEVVTVPVVYTGPLKNLEYVTDGTNYDFSQLVGGREGIDWSNSDISASVEGVGDLGSTAGNVQSGNRDWIPLSDVPENGIVQTLPVKRIFYNQREKEWMFFSNDGGGARALSSFPHAVIPGKSLQSHFAGPSNVWEETSYGTTPTYDYFQGKPKSEVNNETHRYINLVQSNWEYIGETQGKTITKDFTPHRYKDSYTGDFNKKANITATKSFTGDKYEIYEMHPNYVPVVPITLGDGSVVQMPVHFDTTIRAIEHQGYGLQHKKLLDNSDYEFYRLAGWYRQTYNNVAGSAYHDYQIDVNNGRFQGDFSEYLNEDIITEYVDAEVEEYTFEKKTYSDFLTGDTEWKKANGYAPVYNNEGDLISEGNGWQIGLIKDTDNVFKFSYEKAAGDKYEPHHFYIETPGGVKYTMKGEFIWPADSINEKYDNLVDITLDGIIYFNQANVYEKTGKNKEEMAQLLTEQMQNSKHFVLLRKRYVPEKFNKKYSNLPGWREGLYVESFKIPSKKEKRGRRGEEGDVMAFSKQAVYPNYDAREGRVNPDNKQGAIVYSNIVEEPTDRRPEYIRSKPVDRKDIPVKPEDDYDSIFNSMNDFLKKK